MNTNDYQHRLSAAISWLRFPLIFLIILLHGYTVIRITGPASGCFFQSVYPFALWMGETGVPAFFLISGFLFFASKKSYKQKIASRFHTLLIPYVLWNSILLGCYLLAFAMGIMIDINGKDLSSFNIIDYLRVYWDRGSFDNGNSTPLLSPFWYIRNLMVMSLLSPLFFHLIKYIRELFLAIALLWWLLTSDNAFTPQSIFFFSLGGYLAIYSINLLRVVSLHRKGFMALFIMMALLDIITHTLYPTDFNLQIHRLALLANIPALFLLADYCQNRNLSSPFLTNAAFITFAIHHPIIMVIRKASLSYFSNASAVMHIFLYFVAVVITFVLCLAVCFVLDRYFSKLKNILSGNR